MISLYVGRCHSCWKPPEIIQWLERNVKAVLRRVDNKDPLVEDFSNKYVGLNLHKLHLYIFNSAIHYTLGIKPIIRLPFIDIWKISYSIINCTIFIFLTSFYFFIQYLPYNIQYQITFHSQSEVLLLYHKPLWCSVCKDFVGSLLIGRFYPNLYTKVMLTISYLSNTFYLWCKG